MIIDKLVFYCSGAQQFQISLTSSEQFDATSPPSLCPGGIVQFTCIAVNFSSIVWEKNGAQFRVYAGVSETGMNEPVPDESGLSVILNNVTLVAAPSSFNFTSTVTAVVNEGVSSDDVITCGNTFFTTTSITVNYSAIRK